MDYPGPKLRVLIVDDEKLVADTLALIMTTEGYEAATAYSGEEAVEKAKIWKPDILISDVFMGAMTGIDAAIRICKEWPDCRVVLISGQPATGDLLARAEEQGWRFEVLAKPHGESARRNFGRDRARSKT